MAGRQQGGRGEKVQERPRVRGRSAHKEREYPRIAELLREDGMADENMSGADMLVYWRERLGLTRAECARRVGAGAPSWADWEGGTAQPRALARHAIEELTGIPRSTWGASQPSGHRPVVESGSRGPIQLQQWRCDRRLSQRAAAAALGVSLGAFRQWEQGMVLPSEGMRLRLSETAGVRPASWSAPKGAAPSAGRGWAGTQMLVKWRAEQGISAREASRRIGVSATAYCIWESGRGRPEAGLRPRIQELAGVEPGAWELPEA